ncbi:MAG TPA: DEAD/DEAH box helicase [Alphaproteobacteria bacterium]|jgi:superfamily II DNA/RNA helicase|nr:DEAD/DEAH box helicase [Alphaproteobacteria bacterium]HJM52147.1 DEAD/DEAH box helicase [Alphaproteobacteria bacterium]
MTFPDLGLSEEVLRAIEEAGYHEPTPIQDKAIPYVLQGRDVLGGAQTGTGKTAAFALPMIDILAHGRARARMPRALILEPTRELAHQVAENFELYGKYQKLSMALLIGGVSFVDQHKKIDRGVDVLIATPGRLLDHFERGGLMLSGTNLLVIDEADRMLDMGFIPDVERIVKLLPPLRQTLFFSATIMPEIRRLADKFLMNPKEISVAPPTSPAETVDQSLIVVNRGDKREVLRQILRERKVEAALIFCNRKRDVDILGRSLKRHGFNAAALHGDMVQTVRMETLDGFRNRDIAFLVASDVAARGLDISGLPYVFNFDVPSHAEDYIHRIGRTGRAGMPGISVTLAAPDDSKYLDAITRLIGREIPLMESPGVAAATLEDDAPARRGRGRGRERSQSERSQSQDRRPRRRQSAASPAAASPEAEAPAATAVAEPPTEKAAEKPRRSRRPRRDEQRPAAENGGHKRQKPQPDTPPHDGPQKAKPSRRKGATVGFGDQDSIPAFLVPSGGGSRRK